MNRTLIAIIGGVLVLACVCLPVSGIAAFAAYNAASGGTTAKKVDPTPTRIPAATPAPAATPIVSRPTDAKGLGIAFLSALRDFDDDAAFALFHPGLKKEFDGVRELTELIDEKEVRPASWGTWTVTASEYDGIKSSIAKASVKYQDGTSGSAEVETILNGEDMVIIRFRVGS